MESAPLETMSIQVLSEFKVVASARNKITSVTSDATHIYVSFKDGKLLVYEVINGKMELERTKNRLWTAIS